MFDVIPPGFRELFSASAAVAGTLIGLLFVAISVAGDRIGDEGMAGQTHRVRASAALTAFTVSLFALVPDVSSTRAITGACVAHAAAAADSPWDGQEDEPGD